MGLSEDLDVERRMLGTKDGIGVFLVGSDRAELIIALKIKGSSPSSFRLSSTNTACIGKRYKTKNERLRFEKDHHTTQTEVSTMQRVTSESKCLPITRCTFRPPCT